MNRFFRNLRSLLLQSVDRPPTRKFVANKTDRVRSLRTLGVPINSVVDVGVQELTTELVKSVPDKRHHLFEPVELWHSKIRSNYSEIAHTLYPVALSDASGSAWLIQTSLQNNGIATHARIESNPKSVDGRHIVDCKQIEIHRLDRYSDSFSDNFLLKIDVDGKELDILRGATGCLQKASVVIVEADWSSVMQRGSFIEEHGFQLIDIIDRVMYGEVLWQCDLVFLRNDLMNETLRPPLFNPAHWHPLP